jgi:hypothetical protein
MSLPRHGSGVLSCVLAVATALSAGVAAPVVPVEKQERARADFAEAAAAFGAVVLDFAARYSMLDERSTALRTRRSLLLLADALGKLAVGSADARAASSRIRTLAARIDPGRSSTLLGPTKRALTIAAGAFHDVAAHLDPAPAEYAEQVAQLERDIADITPALPSRIQRAELVAALLSANDVLVTLAAPAREPTTR